MSVLSDMSEAQVSTEAMTEQANELKALVAAIAKSQAMISFKMDGTILEANENFLNVMGYSLDEVQGKHHSMFIEPNYASSGKYKNFWESLNQGEPKVAEFKRLAKGRKEVWIQASYIPILDSDGKPIKVVKIASDITQLKLTSIDYAGKIDAVSRSEAMIEFSVDGSILDANENFLSAMGYSLAEIKGQHHSLFVDSQFKKSEEYKSFWAKLSQGSYEAGEFKRLGKGDKEVWIQASYNPILDDDGKVLKVVKFATDVTKRKLESAESEGVITAIKKAQAVIEFDLEGNVLDANDNFLVTMGYSMDEIKRKHHGMFVDSSYRESNEYRQFWTSLRNGELQSGIYKRNCKDGHDVWLKASYNPIFDSEGRPFKIVKFATDITEQQNAQEEVENLVGLAASGNLEHRIDSKNFRGSSAVFVAGVNKLMDTIVVPVKEVARAMQGLSEGNLDQFMEGDFEGEFLNLKNAVNSSLSDLKSLVGGIRESAIDITSASKDISQGNLDLSGRTEQQAASLEETAASMEELASTMKQNAENAREAEKLSKDAKEVAQSGGDVVTNAISAMNDINQASKKIADIIGVIDEIAFQTNLLALNAAVEAARAGEQGRGFAVVATEVRNLAQRSASAAKEIKVLINDSVEKVGEGSQLVNKSGEVLTEIVHSVAKVSDIISEITIASNEQSAGIDQVNSAITDMDSVTQQNAALVEEAAAASESMSDRAIEMQKQIEHFHGGDNANYRQGGRQNASEMGQARGYH